MEAPRHPAPRDSPGAKGDICSEMACGTHGATHCRTEAAAVSTPASAAVVKASKKENFSGPLRDRYERDRSIEATDLIS